jgi:hypothetical protein
MKKLLSMIAVMIVIMALSCVSESTPFSYTHVPQSTTCIQTIDIWVDKNFGNADKLAITEGIEQWNYALNGYIRLNIVSVDFDMEPEVLKRVMGYHGWIFLKIDSSSDFAPIDKGDGHVVLAFVNSIGGNIIYYIRDRIGNDRIYGVTMHEVGHLLGAHHVLGYLMNPRYGTGLYRCVDRGTILQISQYWHIPMEKLNYCEYRPL